jgi:hypothetical protein
VRKYARVSRPGFKKIKAVPKEVLHTRARERLLEHFLSVVLRPGRMPPLTRQSDFEPFIRGPD